MIALQPASQTCDAAASIVSLRDWLDHFAGHVRNVDLDAARTMFSGDVVSFGSWSRMLHGLDDLVERQWANVWPRTSNFHFDLDGCEGAITGDAAWAAATWLSMARPTDTAAAFRRSGRASFVFRRDGDRWLAVHTHYSLDPAGRL